MLEVTNILHRYVEAKRHLWNTYFSEKVESLGDPRVDCFQDIDRLLFQAIVVEELNVAGVELRSLGSEPLVFLEVQLRDEIDRVEVLSSKEGAQRTWSPKTVTRQEFQQYKLLFIDFFDWFPTGRPSFPYFEVGVGSADSSKGLLERWLIKCLDAKVFYSPKR
jgi:hypothetical protein